MSNEMQSDTAWFPFVADARTAALTTLGPDGRLAAVPICFVLLAAAPGDNPILYSPLDEKPRREADPRRLRRVRNLIAFPRASILVSNWDEEWSRLAFVSLDVLGTLLEPGAVEHQAAITGLRRKYPQYAQHRLESRPMLRFALIDAAYWAAGGSFPDRT
jgi:PPOX class probable F420-dependent enzyme